MEKEIKIAMIMATMLLSLATISSASAATYNITDSSYSSYFNASGYINDTSIVSGDVLNVKGKVNNKDMYIDRPLNITSTSKNGKINNGIITILPDGSGTNITNLFFNNTNHNGDVPGTIVLFGANDCRISKNTINTNQIGDDSYGIHLLEASNNQITGNTITTTGDGTGETTGDVNGTITPGNGKYTHGVYLDGFSSGNVINSNNIKTTGASAPVDWSAWPGPGIYPTIGLFIYDESNSNIITDNIINTKYDVIFGNYDTLAGVRIIQSSLNSLIDNLITTTGYSYAYGLEIVGAPGSTASNNIASSNTIVTTGVRDDPLQSYANGLKVGVYTADTLISGNNILAVAPTFAYGVYIEDDFWSGPSVENVTVTGNTIATIAYVNYVIELYAASEHTITDNIIIGTGNFSTGIGAIYSDYNTITDNLIITIGNDSATPLPYNPDEIPESNEGIKLYLSNENTVQNNIILSSGEYAINVTGSYDNIVTNNNLTSNSHIGNNAVAGDRDENTITGNYWWFF